MLLVFYVPLIFCVLLVFYVLLLEVLSRCSGCVSDFVSFWCLWVGSALDVLSVVDRKGVLVLFEFCNVLGT